MTQIRYCIIDNKNLKKGHSYHIIYESKNLKEFMDYIDKKGLK